MNTASHKKILVVEDDESLRKAVVRALTKRNYEVIQASNGQEGLRVALEQHPDLILLDQLMPAMNGLSMLEALHNDEWGVNARVIMTTNISETEMMNQALIQNVKQYVIKSDISLSDLVSYVDSALGITTEK